MRVMCIDNSSHKEPMMEIIPVGAIVTVVGESPFHNAYYIEEYLYDKEGLKCSYAKRLFAPLSEIDEMELVNERELQEA